MSRLKFNFNYYLIWLLDVFSNTHLLNVQNLQRYKFELFIGLHVLIALVLSEGLHPMLKDELQSCALMNVVSHQ